MFVFSSLVARFVAGCCVAAALCSLARSWGGRRAPIELPSRQPVGARFRAGVPVSSLRTSFAPPSLACGVGLRVRAARALVCVYGFLSSPFFVRACVGVCVLRCMCGLWVSAAAPCGWPCMCRSPVNCVPCGHVQHPCGCIKEFFSSPKQTCLAVDVVPVVSACVGIRGEPPRSFLSPPQRVCVEERTSPGHLAAAITTTASVVPLAPATDGRRRGQAGRQAPRPGRALTRLRARHTPAGARSGGPCRGAIPLRGRQTTGCGRGACRSGEGPPMGEGRRTPAHTLRWWPRPPAAAASTLGGSSIFFFFTIALPLALLEDFMPMWLDARRAARTS